MDLAQDILRLAEKVAQVPKLSTMCSLAFQIIATIQTSGDNDADLYLAHLIADRLINIADIMQGRWNSAPEKLGEHLDEFEAILRDVSKAAIAALANAGSHNMDINRLEQRLGGVQRSIIILLNSNTSDAAKISQVSIKSDRARGLDARELGRIQSAVDSQHRIGVRVEAIIDQDQSYIRSNLRIPDAKSIKNRLRDTLLRLVRGSKHIGAEVKQTPLPLDGQVVLKGESDLVQVAASVNKLPTGTCVSHLEENDLRHNQKDLKVRILRKLSQASLCSGDGSELKVALHEACSGGRHILIKTYVGGKAHLREKAFMQDLTIWKTVLHPSALQLMGASIHASSNIPFLVYHAPLGHFEMFGDWHERTLASNPVETINGIYDMRTSIRDILALQQHRVISCDDSPLWGSIVTVHSWGNGLKWALVYAGRLSSPHTCLMKVPFGHEEAIRSRSPPPEPTTNAFRIDLPGSITNLNNVSPVAKVTPTSNHKINPLPFTGSITVVKGPSLPGGSCDVCAVLNLTGRIKVVTGPLRAGGFCDVYAGELTSDRGAEPVAMKMLRIFNTEVDVVEGKKKFQREVSLWCSLKHPYVLPFYGTCDCDEFRLFMVSPWAEGGSSLEYLRRNPSTDRGKLLWQTASALEYLHSGRDAPQIVHGDLKADNVLISGAGDALICDFGLSRYVEEMISHSGGSSPGGHPRFMAPELLIASKGSSQNSRPTTESDVFAFGSLMLQIYTEQLPFGDLPAIPALLKVASGEVPTRPTEPIVIERGFNNEIWVLMNDCWKFEPCMRPSMEEVRRRMTTREVEIFS